MSQVTIQGNANGNGTLTIAAPNTSTNYTLTLPTETGTVLTSGGAIDVNASAPADSLAIDSSGQIGVGVTPNTWESGTKVIQTQAGSLYSYGNGGTLSLLNNFYINSSGTTIYSFNGYASEYRLTGGNHIWYSAASGTAGGTASMTERMRIDSSGSLLVGTTSDLTYAGKLQVYHSSRAGSFQTTGTSQAIITRASDASYTNDVQLMVADRSATDAYNLCTMHSGNLGDIEFKFRGDGNAYADGTFNNNGADYAEYFESANGQPLTLGATVVLDGNKVREATEQDPASAIMGVVRPKEPSKASMVVGNTAWNKWANKYLTDDFDRYIMEDHDVVEWTDEDGKQHSYESHNIPDGITVPQDATVKTHDDKGNKFQHYKLNPAWDKDSEYTPREKRPEWNIIGLVGQVKVLKGQPVNDRWIKMRDVSDTVEEWFIR